MWIGFVLAVPIPVLALSSSGPHWVDVIALCAPFAWAVILGAAGRVAGLGHDAMDRMTSQASAVGDAHEAAMHRMSREASAVGHAHDAAMRRMTTEASVIGHAHDAAMQRMTTEASAIGHAHHAAMHRMNDEASSAGRAHAVAMSRMNEDALAVGRAHVDAMHRKTSAASRAGRAHAAERVTFHQAAQVERTERERLETLQRLMDEELALAQRVNQSLLPEDITRPDLDVIVRQIPCSFVGGDYLHAALPRSDLLYLCVGDVSGHGISAALVVSRIHGLVQRMILEQRAPEQILEDLDRATIRVLEHTNHFMTFAVYRVDLRARRIDYAMAGHPAQVLLHADGSIERLTANNGLLGLRNLDVLGPMQPGSASFGDGDTLILYTDGLFEVPARHGTSMLGEAGLLADLHLLASSPPAVVASELLRRVVEFGKIGPFVDDVSLMVTRFHAQPA